MKKASHATPESLHKIPLIKQQGFRYFLMLVPFIVLIFLISYLPLYSWRLAFFDFRWGRPENPFVGFDVFRNLINNRFQLEELMQAVINTFALSILNVLVMPLPMFFAIFLWEIKFAPFRKIVQTLTTIPHFISWVLVFAVASSAFTVDDGFVNRFLMRIGAIDTGIAFLQSDQHVWLTMIAWNLWKTMGWSAIVYFAALSGIDQEQYDAAEVDGAGRWARIRHITIPGLMDAFFVLFVLNVANFINFGLEQPMAFINVMNRRYMTTIDVFTVAHGIEGRNASMAIAVGILKSLISLIMVFSANLLSKKVRGKSVF